MTQKVCEESKTKEKIKEIELELDNDRYLINEYPEEKLGILDVKAKLNDGVICNIEVCQ